MPRRRIEWRAAAGTGVGLRGERDAQAGTGRDAEGGPYAVAIVELAEGVRMMSNVVGVAPESVAVGTPVRVAWHALSDGRRLPMFTPA